MTRLEGLGSRPAKETIIPIRALSNSPSPLFNLEWRGINLNFCRRVGMSLRAKKYLELNVLGVPKTNGWRLTAFLKDWPHFSANPAGSAPQNGGTCTDFENCANDLSEQILQVLDSRRLLNFYIKLKTPEGWRQVLKLYPTIAQSSLEADDFVAWGNAFFGLNRFDEALQKYQEALEKDPKSCSAQVARGFVYYNRPRNSVTKRPWKSRTRLPHGNRLRREKRIHSHIALSYSPAKMGQLAKACGPHARRSQAAM